MDQEPIVKIISRGERYWIILREPPDEERFDIAWRNFRNAWMGVADGQARKYLVRRLASYSLVRIFGNRASRGNRDEYVEGAYPERGHSIFVGLVMPDGFVFDPETMTMMYQP